MVVFWCVLPGFLTVADWCQTRCKMRIAIQVQKCAARTKDPYLIIKGATNRKVLQSKKTKKFRSSPNHEIRCKQRSDACLYFRTPLSHRSFFIDSSRHSGSREQLTHTCQSERAEREHVQVHRRLVTFFFSTGFSDRKISWLVGCRSDTPVPHRES